MNYTAKAPAKINLALDVLGRRANGYHDVAMIMQTISLYDTITVSLTKEGILLTTDSAAIPTDETNIAFKAANYLSTHYNVNKGAHIHIQKKIPVAAGLAGGSTDAAAVLKLLNTAWELKLSKSELMDIGLKLGADVPFCIQQGACLAEGLGEILTPIKTMPDCYILLAKPPVDVSTKKVYQGLHLEQITKHPDMQDTLKAIETQNLHRLCSNLCNVLENVTTQLHPSINELKQKMLELGALGSLMSGSGPTVFGIFENMSLAEKAYDNIKNLVNEVHLVKPSTGEMNNG